MGYKVLQVAAIDLSIYKFVVPLMANLQEEGFEVSCACKDMGMLDKIRQQGYEVIDIDIERKISPISNIRTIIQLYNLIKKYKINIVHLHTPIAGALGRIAAKLAGADKVIYTAHGYYKDNFLFYNIEKYMAKYISDYIFTVNQEDMDMAVNEWHLSHQKISNINSVGIDTQKFKPDAIKENENKALRESLGLGTKDTVIGFIGRLVKIKGPIDLINAFIKIRDRYPDAKLLMIGTWEHGERDLTTKDTIFKLVKENDLSGRVIFTGYREDIPELLSIMDMFVLPSYWEGMPVSLLEAMSMELPVIGTDIRGSREEITEDCGIIYPPGDVDALAQAIVKYLEDRETATAMGKNARKRVVELFSEEEVLKNQVAIYKKLLSEVIK